MFKKILIGCASAIAILLVVIATRPPSFHVERSIVVSAPAERVFVHVNDFRAWQGWSPYEKLDPQVQRTYGGPASGVGTTYAWASQKDIGEGKMTIEQSDKPSHIGVKLEFIKPFACTNTATFTFAPTAEGTKVTWAMDGTNNFMAKAASLFMNMDKLVGGDFERGLADLKSVSEKGAQGATADAATQ